MTSQFHPRKLASSESQTCNETHPTILCREADEDFRKDCESCCLREIAWSPDFEAHRYAPDFRRINNISLASGETLYREEEPGESVYSIRSGLIKLVQYQRNGAERIVRLLQKGRVAGLEVFVSERYHHTAIVVRSVNVCKIPTGILSCLNSARPRLYEMLLRCWQQSLEMADLWICQFSTGSTEARVARLLLFLTEFGELDHSAAVHLLSRQDMAGILGITCESVCRTISHFRHSGVIRQSAPGLYGVDLDALRTMASK